MIKRIVFFTYGVLCYLVFFATFLYAIGFIGNLFVPVTMDSGREAPFAQALLGNLALLGAFALQHSLMARQWFKRAWTRIVPEPLERSTYVLASSAALLLLFWKWQPMGGTVWHTEHPVAEAIIYGFYALGWVTVLLCTFLIDHFDLFGLRQVTLYLLGRDYTPLKFRTPALYRLVRHPLYLGWLLVFWSTPSMTIAHLLFALATTGYILIAIQFEEKDLIQIHGNEYRQYRQRVPMILPWRVGKNSKAVKSQVAAKV